MSKRDYRLEIKRCEKEADRCFRRSEKLLGKRAELLDRARNIKVHLDRVERGVA